MTKHTVKLTVILILLVAGLLVLTACQPTSSITAKGFDYDQATASMVHRWEVMGQAYEELALVETLPDTADISAARWQAMGEAYHELTVVGIATNAADVSAARWQAMGDAYERQTLLAGGDVSTARWQALGQAYEKSGAMDD